MGFFSKLFAPPARASFAQSVVDALREDGVTDPVSFDEGTFALRLGDGITSRVLHLGSLQDRLLREQHPDRGEILRDFVRRYRDSSAPKSFRDAQQRLLPHVRSRSDFSFSNLMARTDGLQRDDRPFRLLTEEIGIGLMLDDAEMMRGVDHEQLASWGVAEDEAMRVALDNLRARTDPQFVQQQAGIWVSAWRDGYDATRILLPDVVSDLQVRGRPVIVVPHPNLLAVTGDGDPAGLVAMARLAASAFEDKQPISVTPLVREGDAWQELHLDDAHPAAAAMALVRLRLEAQRYDRQQELLAAEAIRVGDETFIAPFIGTRDRQTGAFFSHCPWSEGIRQSLPRTDRVGFVAEDRGPRGFADWVDVLRVMGSAIKPTNDYPPRYAVETFPTEAQLRDMGIPG
ncbi:MAG: hypothetical protein ACXW5U_24840 [Thermoanaerobaculia bacterium]